jgi:methanogenic corrinoid protein MtbC1
MDGENWLAADPFVCGLEALDVPTDFCTQFAAESFRAVSDAPIRRARIADLVSEEIVPRLAALHAVVEPVDAPTLGEITELARLVLSADSSLAAAYVGSLKARGLSVEILFAELLEPAAQLLGRLWDEDEIDFVDVTLGVARLQALLAVFNRTHTLATLVEHRSVLMLTVPGEQHSFGIAMVERFLEAGGWQVTSARETSLDRISNRVGNCWFAVAGIALSDGRNLDKVAATVATIRESSLNRSIGIMVGGPIFSMDAGLARDVGADGTAASGPTAVVLAQKLLDDALAASATRRRSKAALAHRIAGSAAQFAN